MISDSPTSSVSPDNLLLRIDKLRQGDVLLADSGTKPASIIKTLNWGDFSHAAIIISPIELLESNDNGIRHKQLLRGYLRVENTEFECVRVPIPCKKAAVLRHPDPFTRNEFRTAYLATLNAMWGRDYPKWSALVAAASVIPDSLKPVVSEVAALIDGYEERSRTRKQYFYGDFCSQLVFRFYDFLHRPLFALKRLPETIGPNTLASSVLQPVQDAVCICDDFDSKWRPFEMLQSAVQLARDHGAEVMHYKLRMMNDRDTFETLITNAVTYLKVNRSQALQLIQLLDKARTQFLKLIEVLIVEDLSSMGAKRDFDNGVKKLESLEQLLERCVRFFERHLD